MLETRLEASLQVDVCSREDPVLRSLSSSLADNLILLLRAASLRAQVSSRYEAIVSSRAPPRGGKEICPCNRPQLLLLLLFSPFPAQRDVGHNNGVGCHTGRLGVSVVAPEQPVSNCPGC